MDKWTEAQKHEAEYWQNCLGMTAWGEFTKQEMYGREMGLFSEYGTRTANWTCRANPCWTLAAVQSA